MLMKKTLFLFLSLVIFFSCKEGVIEIKGFNLWLSSIIERDLESSFKLKNKVKLSDSLFSSQQNGEKVEFIANNDAESEQFFSMFFKKYGRDYPYSVN